MACFVLIRILRCARSGYSSNDVADGPGLRGRSFRRSRSSYIHRPEWMSRSACNGLPIGVFFPSHGQTAAAARGICSTCTVRPECLDYASTENDTAGVWGGTTERERRHHGQVA